MTGLLESLREVLRFRRDEQNSRYDRNLPFGDCISDRWERAEQLGFGSGTSVYDSAHIFGSVTVGRNCWIGPFTILDGSGGLAIGDNCAISASVQIYTHETVDWATSGGKVPASRAPVYIGSNCYIGPNVIITQGVTIGDGAVIGAGSLVLSDVPAGVKAWGTPCRVQGRVRGASGDGAEDV